MPMPANHRAPVLRGLATVDGAESGTTAARADGMTTTSVDGVVLTRRGESGSTSHGESVMIGGEALAHDGSNELLAHELSRVGREMRTEYEPAPAFK